MWLKGEKAPDDEAGAKVKKLFQLIDCSQKAFCDRLGIRVTTLSSAISGSRPIPDDTWSRVLDGFKQELGTDLPRKFDAMAAATAQALLDDLFESAGRPAVDLESAPGGPLPIGGRAYVQRPCDARIVDGLNHGQRLFAVAGAPQTGRSSLLLRVAAWAEKAGFFVTPVDFNDYVANLKSMSSESLLAAVGLATGIEIPDGSDRHKIFSAFQQQIIKRGKRTLLIFDGVDNAALQDLGKTWDVLLFLLKLRNYFAQHSPNKFAAISVFGLEAWSTVAASSFGAAALLVDTPCFTEQQISQLGVAVTGKKPDANVVSTIMVLFGGHPYLTHLFLDDVRQGVSPDDIAKTAFALKGPYGRHAARIVRRVKDVATGPLCGIPGGMDFSQLCHELAEEDADPIQSSRIDKWLRLFGVIASDGKIHELYRQAFKTQVNSEVRA